MSISDQIERLATAKADIAAAIESKGVDVPSDASISDMAELVAEIPVFTEEEVFLAAYPVGAYYFSSSPTSPASLFGGTWTAITGRFLYMNAGTATGGSNTHTLTVGQMPSHSHTGNCYGYRNGSQYGWLSTQSGSNIAYNEITVGYAGGGESHNNMPAYQTVYAWRRTA